MGAAAGMHEFAEFTADDVGTVESGLNSMVLANNSELVLLPINEPTTGKRKSQIQTYLDWNGGAGVQHLALKTDNIFATLRRMRALSDIGGLEFMPRASKQYYQCAYPGPANVHMTIVFCACRFAVVGDSNPEKNSVHLHASSAPGARAGSCQSARSTR